MKNDSQILSKENSLVLRGLAISAIMFHNYLHMFFCKENEWAFVQANVDDFFHVLAHPEMLVHPGFSIACHIVSFLGWLGVPVFVFLTGYGLARKYPPGVRLDKFQFLKKCYLKLFFLLFPALLFFALADIRYGHWTSIAKRAVGLSMLSNLYYPRLAVPPSVYWYFSLTFQYYILYCFCRKWFRPPVLLVLSVLSLLALYLASCVGGDALTIYRRNFPGWFPLFALGIWFARSDIPGKWIDGAGKLGVFFLFVAMSVLTVAMQAHAISWLAVPIAAFFAFLALAKLVLDVRFVGTAFKWLGGISACLFVCHPVARALVVVSPLQARGLALSLAAYTMLTIVLACFYQKLQNFLSKKWLFSYF